MTDAAWIPLAKWESFTPEQQEKLPPICPDFVIELRFPSDSLKTLQEKMEEYRDNGTRLGWLINRQNRQVEIYRHYSYIEAGEPFIAMNFFRLLGFLSITEGRRWLSTRF